METIHRIKTPKEHILLFSQNGGVLMPEKSKISSTEGCIMDDVSKKKR